MKYIVSINDKNYEVEVERGEARVVKTTHAVQFEPAPAPASIQVAPAGAQTAVGTAPAQNVVGDGETLKAPMPGTILAVKVNSGSAVKRGELLFILEAMKMENEIVAPRDGVVTQILAGKGASVSTGDILAVIK